MGFGAAVVPTRIAERRCLTRGCVASISKVEVGEASRRPRIVVKEPGTLIHANDNLALAA
jgi:hypothetical protein